MQAFPKPEGELFPGVIASLLALIGIVFGGRVTERIPAPAEGAAVERAPSSASGITTRWLAWFFAAVAVGHGVAAVATLLLRRITFDTGLFVVRMSNVNQLLLRGGVAFALMLLVWPAARARTRAFMRDRGLFVSFCLQRSGFRLVRCRNRWDVLLKSLAPTSCCLTMFRGSTVFAYRPGLQ